MLLDKLRGWLVFFRAHTGMLEAPIPALGAAVAIGTLWSYEVALWALAGLLYHYAGYGQNSYYDWKNGYDKDDPHKQHHPLNTGLLDPDRAKLAANLMVVASVFYVVLLVGLDPLPLLILALALISGLMYNLFGKEITHKYAFLAVAHSALFLIPYAHYTGGLGIFALLVFGALVVHHSFQIAISGDVKDIEQDESSILDKIGVVVCDRQGDGIKISHPTIELKRNIYHKSRVDLIVTAVSALQAALVLVAIYYIMSWYTEVFTLIVLYSALALSMWFLSIRITADGTYVRDDRLRNIAAREVVGFWMIYTAFIPVIGYTAYFAAFVMCILYLMTHLKFMWGTYLRPKV